MALAAGVVALAAVVATAGVYASREDAGQPQWGAGAQVAPLPSPVGGRPPWNGRAFINDNLWTHGETQFAVWVDPVGHPIVGRRSGDGSAWQTADLAHVPGNPLAAPTGDDEHDVYAIAVDRGGYVHVAGNMHSSSLRYVRSQKPLEIQEWAAANMVGTEEESVSYPAFVRAPNADLLFFYRDGRAGRGDVMLNRLDAGSRQWRRVATLVDGRSSDESPYLQRVAVDPARNAIHVMFLWRAGAEPAGNRDPSYLRSDDGGTTWRRSDGSAVTLPVTSATAEVVAPTRPGSQALLNQGGLGIDAGGRAHAVFRVQGGGVLHLWSEGPTWRSAAVSGLGRVTGRPAVVGNGRDPLLVLWAQNRSGRRSDLRVARLAAGQTSGSQRLAAMAVDDWEPTFDSTALVEQRRLRVMVPVRVISRSGSAAVTAAIGTWSVPALETASP